jgi:hypothetical protein
MKKRQPFTGWAAHNPTRIVPKQLDGRRVMVVRGMRAGIRYELGYLPGRSMLGNRLRKTRRVMLKSLQWSMYPPEMPTFPRPPRPYKPTPLKSAPAVAPVCVELRRAA